MCCFFVCECVCVCVCVWGLLFVCRFVCWLLVWLSCVCHRVSCSMDHRTCSTVFKKLSWMESACFSETISCSHMMQKWAYSRDENDDFGICDWFGTAKLVGLYCCCLVGKRCRCRSRRHPKHFSWHERRGYYIIIDVAGTISLLM